MSLITTPLTTGWTSHAAAGPSQISGTFPATVPGTVHTDLLAAGLIPDPYLDDNEAALAWIGLVDWTYALTFASPAAAGRHHLVFDGVDTVARITLNGEVLADVENQHRTYRFDVTSLLRASNDLVVEFRSPVREANRRSMIYGARPRPYPLPYEALRKSACNFGWDWGIATYTSGLWRSVRLESWDVARLAEVSVVATPDGDGGDVAVSVAVERASDEVLTLDVTVGALTETVSLGAGETSASVTVHLDEAERWWPVGHGAQPLYDVTVGLRGLDEVTRRVGFRTLEWDMTPDAAGTPFQLTVNDRPIFVKGVNWIPDDALFPRVTPERYRHRLEQAVAANLNLVRVWGGGIYEDDAFYEICDELGLLTWQDFLFACAAYPEDEALWTEVEAEARDNVRRLAHHASLALFTGNNENIWGHEDWGWKARLDGATWGAGYYYELLPAVVAELAPHVPYAPGSPFSPGDHHPNDEAHGTVHLWEQWNRQDYPTYRDHNPRFVAEFGWQGPAAWSTVTAAISDAPLTPESPGQIVHQKAEHGNDKLIDGLQHHFRVPRDYESWHWAMQLNQAHAVRYALDWFRSNAPHTAGAVVWQLNDCWPVTSWAAIDSSEIEKPLYWALKRAFAPRWISVQDGDAVFSNDTATDWTADVAFVRLALAGGELQRVVLPVTVPAFGTFRTAVPVPAENPADEALAVLADDARAIVLHVEPRDSVLAAAELSASVVAADTGFDVTVTASSLVLDLTLLVDKIDPAARVDDGLVSLLPGESHTFHITGVSSLDAADVLRRGVACTANDLVAGA